MVNGKKIGAIVASGVVVFGLGGLSGALLFPQTVVEERVVTETVEVEVPVVETVTETVEVPVEVEVLVDNENLDEVLNHVYEYGLGDLDISDLDDDEVDEIVDRVLFLNDARELARQHVKAEFLDIVDRRTIGTASVEIDEDDVERVRVDDVEDFTLEDIDFDYGDVTVFVPVEFEHDGDEYDVVVEVEIRDGEVEDARLA